LSAGSSAGSSVAMAALLRVRLRALTFDVALT
jgi:hypothetical protein